MRKFVQTVMSAIKLWVRHDAFTAEDALDIIEELNVVEPLKSADGTIYTSPDGRIYTL